MTCSMKAALTLLGMVGAAALTQAASAKSGGNNGPGQTPPTSCHRECDGFYAEYLVCVGPGGMYSKKKTGLSCIH